MPSLWVGATLLYFFHPVWVLTLRSQSCQEGLLNVEMRPSSLVCGYCVRSSGDKPILHMLPCLCSQLSYPSTSWPSFWALFLPFRCYVEPGFKLSFSYGLLGSYWYPHLWPAMPGTHYLGVYTKVFMQLGCPIVLPFMWFGFAVYGRSVGERTIQVNMSSPSLIELEFQIMPTSSNQEHSPNTLPPLFFWERVLCSSSEQHLGCMKAGERSEPSSPLISLKTPGAQYWGNMTDGLLW